MLFGEPVAAEGLLGASGDELAGGDDEDGAPKSWRYQMHQVFTFLFFLPRLVVQAVAMAAQMSRGASPSTSAMLSLGWTAGTKLFAFATSVWALLPKKPETPPVATGDEAAATQGAATTGTSAGSSSDTPRSGGGADAPPKRTIASPEVQVVVSVKRTSAVKVQLDVQPKKTDSQAEATPALLSVPGSDSGGFSPSAGSAVTTPRTVDPSRPVLDVGPGATAVSAV